MKLAAAVLVLVLTGLPRPRSKPAADPLLAPSSPPGTSAALAASQDWLGDPILPAAFRFDSDPLEAQEEVPLDPPPLRSPTYPLRQEAPPRNDPPGQEPSFPRGVGAPDVQSWRQEDELRRIREWAGDALFGAPLLVPQLLLEGVLPRGLAVGPTTFLYRTDKTSASFSLVVFDQLLFHEARFAEQAQTYASDGLFDQELQHDQRRVLRRSIMSGFRATYALPKLSMDVILQTASEQGLLGYALAPPVVGALLYMKGMDQKIDLSEDVHCRFKLASGQRFVRGLHSEEGRQALSLELKFYRFPVGVVACVDVADHGLRSSFIGLGTSLDSVEELLSREELSRHPLELR
jgi:hypothetical protein